MKIQGFIFWCVFIAILLPFFLFEEVYAFYKAFNASNPFIMGALKFAILSTAGELIGLRIKTGNYFQKGFGVIPRMIVWCFLGAAITMAMRIFAAGAPMIVETLGIDNVSAAMKGGPSFIKLVGSFSISLAMNLFFAPVFMTFHKITDTHIMNCGGSMKAFITPIPMGKIMSQINWNVQWGFVFKKTITFFWIPAHTITFMLPSEYQVLFAAALGVALGVILSVAAKKTKNN